MFVKLQCQALYPVDTDETFVFTQTLTQHVTRERPYGLLLWACPVSWFRVCFALWHAVGCNKVRAKGFGKLSHVHLEQPGRPGASNAGRGFCTLCSDRKCKREAQYDENHHATMSGAFWRQY